MAAKKKAKKAKKAPAKKSKKVAKVTRKAPAKKAKKKAPAKRTAKSAKKAPKKVSAKKTPARKTAASAKKEFGEGNYKAMQRFDKAQEAFIHAHKSEIPAMGKAAEAALEGPEGKDLMAAEEKAKGHAAG